MSYKVRWTWAVLACVASILTGCAGVSIDPDTQNQLAVQSAEAKLASGLARYVKSQPRSVVGDDERKRAAQLYNDAVSANNVIVEFLELSLAHRGIVRLEVDEAMSDSAVEKLVAFRSYAQDITSLADISPVDSKAVSGPKVRGVDPVIVLAVTAAKDAFAWWFAENERAREILLRRVEMFRMVPWHEVDQIK